MQLPIYIKKTDRVIPVDTLALVNGNESFASQLDAMLACKPLSYSLLYGLTQSVNDGHAGVELVEGVDKVMAAAEKKLAAILAGTVKVRGKKRTHADPIMHEAIKIARAWWKGQTDTKKQVDIGKMRTKSDKFVNESDEQIVELIITIYAKLDGTQSKAQDIVAANSRKVDEDFDLDDFMPDKSNE